ncbi:Tex family protein [Corynebacterium caspium]|uniref:Tex family protein n=1 Tax=Corynebacterium caspium TaxID=234828 RepID=UPI001FDEE1B5|nr:Tex family protein [Corynebacterium caspium]
MIQLAVRIAQELGIQESQVSTTLALLEEGNTVPFIARYRKEATGGLDDTQLRNLEERAHYLRELEERKASILAAIEEQGKLTAELAAEIAATDTKARLEDLYLPYKKRRKTKADIAREAGLEELTELLINRPEIDPNSAAESFITAGFTDTKKVLEGARAILIDRFALDADLVGEVREQMYRNGQIRATVIAGQEASGEKYKDYFDFAEAFSKLPSHRILALFRGESEGVISLDLEAGEDSFYEAMIAERFELDTQKSAWLAAAVHFGWRTKLAVSSGLDVRTRLKERADQGALEIFATNLRDVLLAAPAGHKTVLGLDPGYRNGVKCALVESTGKMLDTIIIYPHQPQKQWGQAVEKLTALCLKHQVDLLAIGNGTASRETTALCREVAAAVAAAGGKTPQPVVVSESGASIYSASELAAQEFPDMDVSLRGAVSIARRLQDPLAELVKIDPKSIGVGQYQHDVNQISLAKTLDAVVEDAVNAVGVDLNTASVPLLTRVAGVSHTLAKNIVAYRDENGRFGSRKELKKVPRLGPKAFEQCAGFLRIRGGIDPLDASAVHPEAYPIVRKITVDTGLKVADLIGNTQVLQGLNPADYVDEKFGEITVKDIISELDKPGRDPRPEFSTAKFKEGIEKITDLRPGMILQGTVSNVAAFGAFVDIGVHEDGLVHISAMSRDFIKDPHQVVKSGQVVEVKVMEVEVERKRISLSLRLDDEPGQPATAGKTKQQRPNSRDAAPKAGKRRSPATPRGNKTSDPAVGSLAAALRNAGFGR